MTTALGKRVALISGGTYGIGREITLKFAEHGYAVAAFGIDPAQTAATVESLRSKGLEGYVLTGDVSDPADVRGIVGEVMAREQQIDVLVNNAAVMIRGTLLETTKEQWDRAFAVNIGGMFLLTREVLPHMIARHRGAIVNVASGSGYGGPGRLAYCCSKGAVFPFTVSIAQEYAASGIRANTVVPGNVFPTGMTERDADTPERKRKLERAALASPAGRVNTPRDIANAVFWLASDESETVSGSTLEVMIRT